MSTRSHVLPACLAVAALCGFNRAAAAQAVGSDAPEVVYTDLSAPVAQSGVTKPWDVRHAWLEQIFDMSYGHVRVTNTSSSGFRWALFYGEYYDERGRLCFTLPFSQNQNRQGKSGPVAPGETVVLTSLASMAPAVRPATMSLQFIKDADPAVPSLVDVPIPATVASAGSDPPAPIHLRLSNGQLLVPIALIEARTAATNVNAATPLRFRVVAARDAEAIRWASAEFAPKLRFESARRAGQPIAETVLILIRAVQLRDGERVPETPPFDDPWVRGYVANVGPTSNVPPVHLLWLRRQADTDAFEWVSVGSDWGINLFHRVFDPDHHRTHREWIAPAPQE
jgi:hypothetical protein